MACVNPDGSLTPSGRKVLMRLPPPDEPEGISADALSAAAGVPLFRTRASLRELVGAGMAAEQMYLYRRTAAGDAALARDSGA